MREIKFRDMGLVITVLGCGQSQVVVQDYEFHSGGVGTLKPNCYAVLSRTDKGDVIVKIFGKSGRPVKSEWAAGLTFNKKGIYE